MEKLDRIIAKAHSIPEGMREEVLLLITIVRKQREAFEDIALADKEVQGFENTSDYERGFHAASYCEAKKARQALKECKSILEEFK